MARHLDTEVVEAIATAAASGDATYQQISEALGLPASTVRDAGRRAGVVRKPGRKPGGRAAQIRALGASQTAEEISSALKCPLYYVRRVLAGQLPDGDIKST